MPLTLHLAERFPTLEQFFGAYFHQDWPELEGSTDQAVVDGYIRDAGPETLAACISELEQLMAMGMTEQQLEHSLFHELGCYYSPHATGLTCAEWLAQVQRQLVLASSVPRR